MKFVVRVDGEERVVHVARDNGIYRVQIGERELEVDCRTFGDAGALSFLIDRKSYLIESAPVQPDQGRYFARVMGRHYDVDVLDELLLAVRDAELIHEHEGSYTVRAPMPGLVVQVKVAVGDHVAPGDAVVVMEAMKMRNELTSEIAGTVTEVVAAAGAKVDSQAPLVAIERD